MALVTLTKYKTAIGETSSANDQKHQDALDDASAVVAAYTDRDLGVALTTEDRTYRYDGSGFLEIDDAAAVNSVRYSTSATPLATSLWEAKRDGPPGVPYSYIETFPQRRISGEMGFTYDLDQAILRGILSPEWDLIVNAQWGWATVPADIQRAVIWTAISFETSAETGGGIVTSDSVAEVARSYAFQGAFQANVDTDELPARARAILDRYRRHVM